VASFQGRLTGMQALWDPPSEPAAMLDWLTEARAPLGEPAELPAVLDLNDGQQVRFERIMRAYRCGPPTSSEAALQSLALISQGYP
jgi:hypothetical protein